MTSPRPGARLTVRVDDGLHGDLATVMRTGMTASDAVRTALRLLADAHRCAWDYQDVPDGEPVRVLGVHYALADGTPAPIPHPHDTSYTRATPDPREDT